VSLGPPPQGSWGASWGGGPGPKSEGRSVANPLGFRIKIYVDFDIDFGSFGRRSWVPLGSRFRSAWRVFPLKLVPEPLSNRLIFEKVILHEIVRFPILLGSSGSHMAPPKRPRSLQDRSLIVMDRFFSTLDFRFDFGSFSAPFWVVLGRPNGPLWVGEKSANRPLGGSKSVMCSSWCVFSLDLRLEIAFWSLFDPSWHHLGALPGSFAAS
jgi:hypothetical protein